MPGGPNAFAKEASKSAVLWSSMNLTLLPSMRQLLKIRDLNQHILGIYVGPAEFLKTDSYDPNRLTNLYLARSL